MATTPHPLSTKLREKAGNIGKLLSKYQALRYGDHVFRYGDDTFLYGDAKWKETNGKEGTPPGQGGTPPGKGGVPPKIVIVSSPRNIYYEEEQPLTENTSGKTQKNNLQTVNGGDEKKKKKTVNPLLNALQDLGELTEKEISFLQLEHKVRILEDLGITERYNCSALFLWVRALAAQITYVLETREIYSTEIKAIYPELLNDLEIARSTCDQLAHTLSKQSGVLTSKQYIELIARLLHYAKIAQEAALQLADHHEQFLATEVSPLERGPEVDWVFREEGPEKPSRKEEKPKEEEE